MKTQASFVATVIVMCVLPSCQDLWAYEGGTGTPEDPYLICTPEQMNSIGLNPEDWGKHFRLIEDIDLSLYAPNQFNLIGLYRTSEDPNERLAAPFSGVFDGQGHTIANFTYEVQGDEDPAHGWVHGFGLLGLINGTNARIKDLTLRDPNLYPSSTCLQRVGSVGALAGIVKSGLITGCRVEGGHIRADGDTGGLVGCVGRDHIDGTFGVCPILLHCSTNCAVSRTMERSFIDVEGADFFLQSCYGGMVGYNSGALSDCAATGPVSGGQKAGGFVGETSHSTVISQCYAYAVVSVPRKGGGLVGLNGGAIQMSWADGEVSGASTIGGLVGAHWKWQMEYPGFLLQYDGAITDSYALTDVICEESQGGGLVGANQGGTVLRCFAAGEVIGGQNMGGLVGTDSQSYPSDVQQSFWDRDATGLSSSAKGMGLTTRQMQNRTTYVDAGWDFADETLNGIDDIWYTDPNVAMYPQLAWETDPKAFSICNVDDY